MTTYQEFLEAKSPRVIESGDMEASCHLSDLLKPHQRDLAAWAMAACS